VEKGFSKRVVKALATTTTLMQGVNLPAQNIIIRNPALYINKREGSVDLSAYEFSNLRGRAGRLMKDLVGRAIILDEATFTKVEIDLSSNEHKLITPGYGERFEKNRNQILEALVDSSASVASGDANDLTIYIRQTILRHRLKAADALERVGIKIDPDILEAATDIVDQLSIPPDLCLKNQYWDPVVLEKIFLAEEAGTFNTFPKQPFHRELIGSIVSSIKHLRDICPYYVKRYLGSMTDRQELRIAVLAKSWAIETPLCDILKNSKADASDVDSTVQDIMSTVSYDLTKLLRPLVSIQDSDNSVLGCIETGAYRPLTRKLMDRGIGREAALRFSIWASDTGNDTEALLESDKEFNSAVQKYTEGLSYWASVQFEDIILS